ncbi:DUF421 domain-containing protein [Halobacillus karajensis]|uniref:YetF C-terminal domain-containing protein n=1 Tax=Halobacillus karajensis TaxID=195088 RepID=A0A024P7A2_9BACI|nr:DUF421 domain-containing protein [Halobacillus karajensis]CDQ17796.1 hypothetical protein BN982_00034 [Halobacillus karajensis]CDQ24202.1 hypothetical protein BN983_02474 [Halobacillus karajensis]CDQ29549.1 hypothetical protein BN981_03932 [Halobacillus karajensis]
MEDWMEFTGRGITVFFILYILARILSKKLISQMTLFDFIAGITLGSMTATTFLSKETTLSKGAFGLLLFAILVLVIDYFTMKSLIIRKLVNSEPTLLMDNGRILIKNMKKVRFTIDELIAELRKNGVFRFDNVQTAILETDGSVSVLQKADYSPVTPKGLRMETTPISFPRVVVVQGKILRKNLNASGYDETWLKEQLNHHGVTEWKDVLVVQINPDGTIYLETLNGGMKSDRKQ